MYKKILFLFQSCDTGSKGFIRLSSRSQEISPNVAPANKDKCMFFFTLFLFQEIVVILSILISNC